MNIISNGINNTLQIQRQTEQQRTAKVNKKEIDNKTVNNLASKLEEAQDGIGAVEILLKAAKDGEIEQLSGNNFKSGNYYILNLFKFDAVPFAANMKMISDLNLGIAPEQITVIQKDNEYFIVSKIEGCESGNLIPFQQVKTKLSKENKLAAYKDLQKLTRAGIADAKVLRSTVSWYVTPDNNRVVIPVWESLYPLNSNLERNQAMEKYYKMLFSE